jgi:hypothetical protein
MNSQRIPLLALLPALVSCGLGPSDCHTVLARTTSCRGRDESWIECRYRFRADGVPDPKVCRAFLAAGDTGPPNAKPLPGCPEASAAGWEKVPCEKFHLEASMACFSCNDSQPEASRRLVQAFAPSCERGIVLKSCNDELP